MPHRGGIAPAGANRACFRRWMVRMQARTSSWKPSTFCTGTDSLERTMKAGSIALAIIALAAVTTRQAEARIHHWDSYYSCHQYSDYTHSNALSGLSYIYPAANWGPFFACHMYYVPVVSAPMVSSAY
jgi:hypothetical protein